MSVSLWYKLSKCFFDHTERKRKAVKTKIFVGGDDKFNILGEKPNNKDEDDYPIIGPHLNSSLNSSSLLSYSVYGAYSVLVTKGPLLGIGYNRQFTWFSIKDDSCLTFQLSAVFVELFTCFQKEVVACLLR